MLDASVLVPHWSRVVLQRLALEPNRRYQPVWSEWIIAETWRVLTRERVEAAGRSRQSVDWRNLGDQANEMMWYLLRVMTMVPLARRGPLPAPWPGLTDPNDGPIWATASLGGADYVVSHNTRHFPPPEDGRHVYEGIEYLTTVEFVEEVLGADIPTTYGEPLTRADPVRSRRRP